MAGWWGDLCLLSFYVKFYSHYHPVNRRQKKKCPGTWFCRAGQDFPHGGQGGKPGGGVCTEKAHFQMEKDLSPGNCSPAQGRISAWMSDHHRSRTDQATQGVCPSSAWRRVQLAHVKAAATTAKWSGAFIGHEGVGEGRRRLGEKQLHLLSVQVQALQWE